MQPRFWPLLPLFAAQAAWVVARTARLPEAEGERQGTLGRGEPMRLLVLGDSSAAGVGVATQTEALSGRIGAALAQDRRVDWQLIARSGATAASTCVTLAATPDTHFDVAVVCLGVNDAKNGVRLATFRRRMDEIVETLRGRFGVSRIVLSGLPPLERFPILPSPLNRAIGTRAALFDKALRDLAARLPNALHVPLDPEMDLKLLAPDGFHPGPDIYREWGALLAAAVTEAPDREHPLRREV